MNEHRSFMSEDRVYFYGRTLQPCIVLHLIGLSCWYMTSQSFSFCVPTIFISSATRDAIWCNFKLAPLHTAFQLMKTYFKRLITSTKAS